MFSEKVPVVSISPTSFSICCFPHMAALNLRFSCLSLLSARTRGVCCSA